MLSVTYRLASPFSLLPRVPGRSISGFYAKEVNSVKLLKECTLIKEKSGCFLNAPLAFVCDACGFKERDEIDVYYLHRIRKLSTFVVK